jgi:nitroimidazol reductase NimA-like FMN-containing flavoprotein (pyridoxamine 5'-phosphate oxidase superfamily)
MAGYKYKSDDHQAIDRVLSTAPVGHLGILTPDGYPRVVPLNYVSCGETIYFHGARHGEKYEVLQSGPKVSFNVDIPYSVIPSNWTSKSNAGTATMFYESVLIKGRCTIVENPDEKTMALQKLMEKFQPEGGYKPISNDEPIYQSLLSKTAIFRIEADQVDLKVKFNQDKSPEYKQMLILELEKRSEGMDLKTAEVLRTMLK